MRAEFADALEKYRDGTIQKAGRIELARKFQERFPLLSKTMFTKLVNDQLRPPTPDEEDWLVEQINHYYERYKGYSKPNPQMSLLASA